MNRRSLGFLAIVLIVLMGVVAMAGLDNLPKRLHNSVAAASTRLSTDQGLFGEHREALRRAMAAEPELLAPMAAAWQGRIDRAQARLAQAATELDAAKKLAAQNRRTGTAAVEQALARFEEARKGAVDEARQVQADAQRWVNYKRELPQQLDRMQANLDALKSFDVDAAAGTARKAMADWPAKQADLQNRLNALKAMTQSEGAAAAIAAARARVEAKNLAGFEYPGLFQKADALDQNLRQVKEGADSLNALAGQLYTSWDKVLLDLDDKEGRRRQVRVVKTRYQDAALQKP